MTSKIDNITRVPDAYASRPVVRYSEQEIQNLIDNYIQALPTVPRTTTPQAEIDDFFTKVHDAIISRQNTDGVSEEHRLLFMAESSPQEDKPDMESITYLLTSRQPGSFHQGSAGSSGIKEVSAHQRYVIDDPNHPSQKLLTMGRVYDNTVKFNIYARGHDVAIKRLLWFQRVMDGFNWYFRLNGYRVIELGMDERYNEIQDGLKLTKYPVSYFVRTDDAFQISTQELRQLVIKLEVSKD